MLKFTLHILLFLTLTEYALSQHWEKSYGGSLELWGYEAIETYDQGHAIIASSFGPGGRIRLIKTDINGNILWVKFIGWYSDELQPISFQQTYDYGFVIVGREVKYDSYGNPFIMKLDHCGNLEWIKLLGQQNDYDYANKVVLTNDKGYAVLASYVDTNRVSLFKLDSAGNVLWQKNYLNQYLDPTPESIIKTKDNGFLINAYAYIRDTTNTGPYWIRSIIIKTDSSGNQEWHLPFGIPQDIFTQSGSSFETLDSGFVTLCTYRSNTIRYGYFPYLFKVDKNGLLQWHKQIGDTVKSTDGIDIASISDTTAVFISHTSYRSSLNSIFDFRLKVFKIDTSGNLLDSITYGGNNKINLRSINNTSTNKLIICGTKSTSSSKEIYVTKLKPDLTIDSLSSITLRYDSLCDTSISNSSIAFYVDTNKNTTKIDNIHIDNKPSITSYPNPVKEVLNIKINERNNLSYSITIIDINGKIVFQKNKLQLNTYQINVNKFKSGIYSFIIKFENSYYFSDKFINIK